MMPKIAGRRRRWISGTSVSFSVPASQPDAAQGPLDDADDQRALDRRARDGDPLVDQTSLVGLRQWRVGEEALTHRSALHEEEEHRIEHDEQTEEEGRRPPGAGGAPVEEKATDAACSLAELGRDLLGIRGQLVLEGDPRREGELQARRILDLSLHPRHDILGEIDGLSCDDSQEAQQGEDDEKQQGQQGQDRGQCLAAAELVADPAIERTRHGAEDDRQEERLEIPPDHEQEHQGDHHDHQQQGVAPELLAIDRQIRHRCPPVRSSLAQKQQRPAGRLAA